MLKYIILGGLIGFSGPFIVSEVKDTALLAFIPVIYYAIGLGLSRLMVKDIFNDIEEKIK